jgi:hypothetical protein
MKMKGFHLSLILVLVFSVGLVLAAKPNTTLVPATNVNSGVSVIIPAHAVEVAPGVFYLGTGIDKGRVVEGYAFIDYKKGFGKPTGCNNDGKCQGWEDPSCADCAGGGNGGETDTSSCYGFLARGAKWKTVESYIVDPVNSRGLDETFVRGNLALDISKWENAAAKDILGDEIAGIVDGADTVNPDNKNEMYFADVDQSGAIAITIVWGIFRGPPGQRELVEWDQVYDHVDFDWSATGEAGKMDFENIATHELGHSVGLDDLYDSKCSEQTMYGYAANGEIKKRTLESGDIAGVQKLYS